MNNVFKKVLGVFVFVVALLFTYNVNAVEMSDEFRSLLNEDGALVVNSIAPTSFDEAGLLIGDYALYEGTEGKFGVYPDACNDDYTVCKVEYYETGESHDVKIVYNYDRNIKKMVDEYVQKIGNKTEFYVRDMEVVNFWINAKGDEVLVKNYSNELKSYFDFKNFELDIRMGNPDEFLRSTGGFGNIVFDNKIYHLGGQTEVIAKHILYVSEEVGDTKEDLMEAIQKRIDDYVGKGVVNVTYGGNVYDYHINSYNKTIEDAETELALEKAKPENEQDFFTISNLTDKINWTKEYKENFINDWNSNNGYYSFLNQAEGEHYFYATIPSNEGSENVFKFIVIKDSSKIYEPSHITVDANTNVVISSNHSSVPLDTIINVKEITSGEVYEKIIKLLNVKDNLTFDLKLYSESLKDYVKKLYDGTFEVRIPLQEKFKNKDLKVYYVDENGKKEEYKVEIKDDYAVFKTNHFSIYTLAIEGDENVPNTFDGIVNILIIGLISLIGFVSTVIYFKKKNEIRVK